MAYNQQNYRGNTIYDRLNNNKNNYNNNQNNAYGQGNQASGLTRKNQADFNKNNNNNINNATNSNKNISNLKYPDLEIQTHFNDGSINDVNSQSNMELDSLMKEYQIISQDIHNMMNQFSGGTDNTYKLNNIKNDLKELDAFSALEHAKFLSELIDISKDTTIYDYDYKKYKNNTKFYDDKIKKVISENKYEIILSTNKNSNSDTKERINNYIKNKKEQIDRNKNMNNYNEKKYENPNSYEPPRNNYNNYNNYENQNKPDSSSRQQFNFGNSIYGNNQNSNQDSSQRYPQYGFGNNIYANQNSSNSNKKYEDPNRIGNGDIYGNDNNYRGRSIYGNYNPNQYESQNYGGKISVRFTYQNTNKTQEYNPNDKADALYYFAYGIKDSEPKIYNRKGRSFTYETLKDLRIIDVFEGAEPELSIY